MGDAGEITGLLHRWGQGDRAALQDLIPLVYRELQALAASYLRRERPDHTLQRTALVHELYLRLTGAAGLTLENRAHFYGVAARIMRQILVDHARRCKRDKRGGGRERVPIQEALDACRDEDLDLLALDEALDGLAAVDARKSRIVEMRYFGGLGMQDIADLLGLSLATVKRDWAVAKLWLYRQLKGLPADDSGAVA
jgi:RNA polymerase sigma factor (TIGR02999 family)